MRARAERPQNARIDVPPICGHNAPTMTNDSFASVSGGLPTRLARAWLALGLAALACSGLLAILLVLSRTPGIQDVFPLRDFFRAALVVHVDLSVLVWFVSCAGIVWSIAADGRFAALAWAGFGLALAGTAAMALSPFMPEPQPLLNNYIPVLQQDVFFVGLALFGLGGGLTLARTLVAARPRLGQWRSGDGLRWGAYLAALAGAFALAAFVGGQLNPPAYSGQARYEAVFWGGGHALQFQHAMLLLVAWWWLLDHLGEKPRISPRWFVGGLALAFLPVLATPLILADHPAGSGEYFADFAKQMEFGHPLMAPLILAAALAIWRTRAIRSPVKSALWASFLLFAVGGVLAYLIRGVNVVIPAHYHGSIVGITLAFMGLAFAVLPRLGFGRVEGRLACWQPYIYGGGQLLHILGLAWSGGYGVQRKVAGAEQMLVTLPQQIGMGLMGLGGLIAVTGGVLFVWVCLRAMMFRRESLEGGVQHEAQDQSLTA